MWHLSNIQTVKRSRYNQRMSRSEECFCCGLEQTWKFKGEYLSLLSFRGLLPLWSQGLVWTARVDWSATWQDMRAPAQLWAASWKPPASATLRTTTPWAGERLTKEESWLVVVTFHLQNKKNTTWREQLRAVSAVTVIQLFVFCYLHFILCLHASLPQVKMYSSCRLVSGFRSSSAVFTASSFLIKRLCATLFLFSLLISFDWGLELTF